jgi:hypothetical protein
MGFCGGSGGSGGGHHHGVMSRRNFDEPNNSQLPEQDLRLIVTSLL